MPPAAEDFGSLLPGAIVHDNRMHALRGSALGAGVDGCRGVDRTAAEWKNVACATRRRRRILLRRILFYFIGKTAYGALLN